MQFVPMSLEAVLEHSDPFNNSAARAHFEHQLMVRVGEAPEILSLLCDAEESAQS
jgi:hypothetical protein